MWPFYIQVPWRALVYIKFMVPVLVPCPLALLGCNRIQQAVMQDARYTCRVAVRESAPVCKAHTASMALDPADGVLP